MGGCIRTTYVRFQDLTDEVKTQVRALVVLWHLLPEVLLFISSEDVEHLGIILRVALHGVILGHQLVASPSHPTKQSHNLPAGA